MGDHERIAVCVHGAQGYAKGGLASAAKNVADAGVGGDTMIVHVNRDEFAKMHHVFGSPTINPHTGMPQFASNWLGPIAGIVGSLLGGGTAVGGALNGALGLGLSDAAQNTIGSGLIGAGVGGLTGGGQGALYGGLAGAATPLLSGLLSGSSGSSGSGGGLLSGLFGNSSGSSPTSKPAGIGSDAVAGVSAPSGAGSSGSSGGLFGNMSSTQKIGALAAGLVLANAIGSRASGNANQAAAAAQNAASQAQFNTKLPVSNFNRTRTSGPADATKYGFGPQQSFFSNNSINGSPGAARGGLMAHVASRKPSNLGAMSDGRSDDIPARLSPDEYVLDAETVGMLGNGSPKAGAAKLDQMRQNVRKHKGSALAKGKFSPNAKTPEQYMMGGAV